MKNKPTEIVYVEGLPKNISPSADYLKSLKVVDRLTDQGELYRRGRVWNYEGPLERGDFDAINKIFCSNQLYELASDKEEFLERLKLALNGEKPLTNTWYETQTITPQPKRIPRKDFVGKLFRLYHSVEQKPYEKRTEHVENVEIQASGNLIRELEKIIGKNGIPDSTNSVQSLILREAEKNGKYYPIGEYLIFEKSSHADITVFLDNEPKGTIQFIPDEEKRSSYRGAYSGEDYPTNIKVDVNGKVITTEKNMWCISQENTTLWELDDRIRKEILNEGDTQRFIGGC